MVEAIAILSILGVVARIAIVRNRRARRRRIRRIAVGAVFGTSFRCAVRPQAVRREVSP